MMAFWRPGAMFAPEDRPTWRGIPVSAVLLFPRAPLRITGRASGEAITTFFAKALRRRVYSGPGAAAWSASQGIEPRRESAGRLPVPHPNPPPGPPLGLPLEAGWTRKATPPGGLPSSPSPQSLPRRNFPREMGQIRPAIRQKRHLAAVFPADNSFRQLLVSNSSAA